MPNNKRFRFQVSGYIEVLAESPLAARAILTNPVNDTSRVFTINEGPVFVFVVPTASNTPEEHQD